jgi:prepilin-type N-terminal cleavage/methylation domain-containing protein
MPVRRLVRHAGRSLRSTRGFTLVELLVTVAAGTVVMIGLFTIIDVTLHQTTKTYDRVDATQRARTTLENIFNELHSACIAPQDTPIQPGSTPTSLLFVSQYSNSANVTPVVEHQVYLDSSNNLWEKTYASIGNISPPWTFSTTPSTTRLLLNNVRSVQFQYFSYTQVSYKDAAGNPYMMILDGTNAVPGTTTIPPASPLTTPLSTTDAGLAVEVTMNMVVGPGGGTGENTNADQTDASVFDSAILRLSPAANHAGNGATFNPCE